VSDYRVESTPGACKRQRVKTSGAQVTFVILPERASAFAAALVPTDAPCDEASLVVEQVSRPMHALGPLIGRPPEPTLRRDATIVATDHDAAVALFAAALADYVECWFVPRSGNFVVYADDDEYATVLAPRQGPVSRAGERLRAAGFQEVVGYERRW
jgi:hypothetical protein